MDLPFQALARGAGSGLISRKIAGSTVVQATTAAALGMAAAVAGVAGLGAPKVVHMSHPGRSLSRPRPTHFTTTRRAGGRALATLDEARQYGKPIYPFLLNEYVDSNVLLRGQVVKRSAWREELSLCCEHADGVVLWGGSGRACSETADWWLSARELLLSRLS